MENHERELAYITLNDWVGLPVADFVGMTVEERATSLRYLLDESDRDNPTFDPAVYDTIQKRAQAIYDLAEEKKAESAAYLGKLGGRPRKS